MVISSFYVESGTISTDNKLQQQPTLSTAFRTRGLMACREQAPAPYLLPPTSVVEQG